MGLKSIRPSFGRISEQPGYIGQAFFRDPESAAGSIIKGIAEQAFQRGNVIRNHFTVADDHVQVLMGLKREITAIYDNVRLAFLNIIFRWRIAIALPRLGRKVKVLVFQSYFHAPGPERTAIQGVGCFEDPDGFWQAVKFVVGFLPMELGKPGQGQKAER